MIEVAITPDSRGATRYWIVAPGWTDVEIKKPSPHAWEKIQREVWFYLTWSAGKMRLRWFAVTSASVSSLLDAMHFRSRFSWVGQVCPQRQGRLVQIRHVLRFAFENWFTEESHFLLFYSMKSLNVDQFVWSPAMMISRILFVLSRRTVSACDSIMVTMSFSTGILLYKSYTRYTC